MAAWSLAGKVVLVTGGGGGIGAATARELRARGAVPVLADYDPDALEATARTFSPAPLTVVADVVDAAACEAAVRETLERHGRLDVVWANAGIASGGPLAATDPEAWALTIDVNLLGAFRTVRAALPAVTARRGYVAVTASTASFVHAPLMSAYCASKAGVEAMANALRLEVAHDGVDVGTIHPTWIATPMVQESESDSRAFQHMRALLRPPFDKTYPVERAARDIADGFERRGRRICVPGFMRALHVLRAAATTRLFEADIRRAAPEILRLWAEDAAERGRAGASVSDRTARQLHGVGETVGT